jgi:predicted kinase
MLNKLIIIRGVPGSGKTTIAKMMMKESKEPIKHYEADMFLMEGGVYKFDVSKLGQAHNWCRSNTFKSLSEGFTVIVSNTFTTLSEMKDYIDYAKNNNIPVEVYRTDSQYKSIHNVPDATIKKMEARFQDYAGETLIG